VLTFINSYIFLKNMPAPRLRSRSLRKVYRKVPGGRTAVHYKKKRPKTAKCSNCGAVLKGVPREFPFRMRKMAKTKKRPERPFGGVLCSRCMRQEIIEKTRQ
jgi:large subunit ribosomal protein L34e